MNRKIYSFIVSRKLNGSTHVRAFRKGSGFRDYFRASAATLERIKRAANDLIDSNPYSVQVRSWLPKKIEGFEPGTDTYVQPFEWEGA